MTICEKCWGDAYLRTLSQPDKSQYDHYLELIEERKANPCTPTEQRGNREWTPQEGH